MIKLIIDEYNKWVKDPNNYLNASLYKKGYDPYFPPMQLMGNVFDSKTIIAVLKNNKVQDDGTIKYNEKEIEPYNHIFKIFPSNLIHHKKLFVVGLEPHKKDPHSIHGSYQSQYKLLYPPPHSTALVNGRGNIITHRKDINFNDYLEWQLNYFTTHSPLVSGSKYWKYMEKLIYGFNGLSLGNGIIHFDLITMHSDKHYGPICKNSISLFETKIEILNIEKILINGKSSFDKILRHYKKSCPITHHTIGKRNIYLSSITVKGKEIKLIGMSQLTARPTCSYIDAGNIGKYISTL